MPLEIEFKKYIFLILTFLRVYCIGTKKDGKNDIMLFI